MKKARLFALALALALSTTFVRAEGAVAYYLDDPSKKHTVSAAVALGFKSTR
jgi:hypothetical protein